MNAQVIVLRFFYGITMSSHIVTMVPSRQCGPFHTTSHPPCSWPAALYINLFLCASVLPTLWVRICLLPHGWDSVGMVPEDPTEAYKRPVSMTFRKLVEPRHGGEDCGHHTCWVSVRCPKINSFISNCLQILNSPNSSSSTSQTQSLSITFWFHWTSQLWLHQIT